MPRSNSAIRVDFRRSLAVRCLKTWGGGGGEYSRWRDALFFLLIGGVLAYGGAFAWYMLACFDLVNLLRDVNGDDSFYYFQIARNLAEGKFSTFDSGVTRTNGYHPLWLFLITPFYWAFDKEAALFAIKAFEIALVAGGVACVAAAARVARLSWVLFFAALPALFRETSLYHGLEAAAALFMLCLFILALCLFARNSTRWKWPLAAVAFALPWVRLEYIAISLAATGALCLLDRPWRGKPRNGRSKELACSIPTLEALAPLLAACAGILTYFIYNRFVFGGIVPVSGVVKQMWSQSRWEREGGYSLTGNFLETLELSVFGDKIPLALFVCVCFALVWRSVRRSRSREGRLLLVFLTGVFGLAAGHLAKFAQSVLTVHPYWGGYGWYFVPAYLMDALIIPVVCCVVIHFTRRFVVSRSRRAADVLISGVVVVGTVIVLAIADFTFPFRFVDLRSESTVREWEISSHMGTLVMDRLLPENSVVGSWDAGVIGYFSRFPVVNLDGLVNSRDYARARDEGTEDAFWRLFGITHFANVRPIRPGADTALFEGPLYRHRSSATDRRFKLWSAASPETEFGGTDRSAWFWRKMAPHFDYESESLAVVVDGNMAQAFSRDCGPAAKHDEWLVFSWSSERGETIFRGWRPWRDAGENAPGICVNAYELPNDARPPIRVRSAPAGSILVDDRLYIEERALALFADGLDGWLLEGDAVTNHARYERYRGQQPIGGNEGAGFLTSYHPDKGDRAVGRAFSPVFTAKPGEYLTFLIAGGKGVGVGLRLLADGKQAALWRGENTERFRRMAYPLAGFAGQPLQLELFDDETSGWGHIMLDHVMLAHRIVDDPE